MIILENDCHNNKCDTPPEKGMWGHKIKNWVIEVFRMTEASKIQIFFPNWKILKNDGVIARNSISKIIL